jgi:hypothetical protein
MAPRPAIPSPLLLLAAAVTVLVVAVCGAEHLAATTAKQAGDTHPSGKSFLEKFTAQYISDRLAAANTTRSHGRSRRPGLLAPKGKGTIHEGQAVHTRRHKQTLAEIAGAATPDLDDDAQVVLAITVKGTVLEFLQYSTLSSFCAVIVNNTAANFCQIHDVEQDTDTTVIVTAIFATDSSSESSSSSSSLAHVLQDEVDQAFTDKLLTPFESTAPTTTDNSNLGQPVYFPTDLGVTLVWTGGDGSPYSMANALKDAIPLIMRGNEAVVPFKILPANPESVTRESLGNGRWIGVFVVYGLSTRSALLQAIKDATLVDGSGSNSGDNLVIELAVETPNLFLNVYRHEVSVFFTTDNAASESIDFSMQGYFDVRQEIAKLIYPHYDEDSEAFSLSQNGNEIEAHFVLTSAEEILRLLQVIYDAFEAGPVTLGDATLTGVTELYTYDDNSGDDVGFSIPDLSTEMSFVLTTDAIAVLLEQPTTLATLCAELIEKTEGIETCAIEGVQAGAFEIPSVGIGKGTGKGKP